MTPIMYLPSYTPVTTGLYIYQKETERVLNTPILFAASLMILVVPVTMFALFQDKFMSLSFGGGIKG
jgi:ABC-type glycerol-3-phosphate transport system permease component